MFGLVVFFGPGPVLCCFAVLPFGETQIWLGDLRVVFGCSFLFLVGVDMMICLRFRDHMCPFLNAFHRLLNCKDRA